MTEDERWAHLVALDEELLRGGVILSEWCAFIVREADLAFASGAHLASILTAVSAIETHLRVENNSREKLALLIDRSDIEEDLRHDLHHLRRYRNRWVHVDNPENDAEVLEDPGKFESELEREALFAARALRRTIYSNPWI
jgi:hypothetical protein